MVAAELKDHRKRLVEAQSKGLTDGWVFPSRTGTLQTPGSMWYAWDDCLARCGIQRRFTVHGLRHTFNDLSRRAHNDPAVTKALTGHLTERMREHYSTVRLDETRTAVAKVIELVPMKRRAGADGGADDPQMHEHPVGP